MFAAMGLFVVFLLGIVNFAAHCAVLESGHPLLDPLSGKGQLPPSAIRIRPTLFLEFIILTAAMLLVWKSWQAVFWAYILYSAANGLSAWLILTRRV